VAAVQAITDPTRHHVETFLALAQRRAHATPPPRQPSGGLAYRSLTDEPDVAALVGRLALPAG
jgi:hypothetical protein